MNMNPSQYTRGVNRFLFAFILLFSGMAQAISPQRILPGTGTPLSKIVLSDILKDLDINPNGLSGSDWRELPLALNDPTHLIGPYRIEHYHDNRYALFSSPVSRDFFFSRFDLQKHSSDTLFTQLFTEEIHGIRQELFFEDSKRNWDEFLDGLRDAKIQGRTQIKETDLEAAAMSFIYKKFPNTYHRIIDEYLRVDELTYMWALSGMGQFFYYKFNINHYISPYFTLTSDHHYHQLIMNMIWEPSFLKQGNNLALIESKEFALKIWKDVTEEITRRGNPGMASFSFAEFVVKSVEAIWDPAYSSQMGEAFMRAMEEAAREDDRLAQLVKTVQEFASNRSNVQGNYRENLLEIIQEAVL